jgi:tetratricopeptide (TPR) repeat protein
MREDLLQAANLINQRQFDQAIALLESVDDGSLDKANTAFKYLHLGIANEKVAATERCVDCYNKAIEFCHPTGLAFERLAIVLTKAGRLEEALEACQRFIDHPTIPEPRSYLTKGAMKERSDRIRARLEKTHR